MLPYSINLSLRYQLLILVPSFVFVYYYYLCLEFRDSLPNVLDSSN